MIFRQKITQEKEKMAKNMVKVSWKFQVNIFITEIFWMISTLVKERKSTMMELYLKESSWMVLKKGTEYCMILWGELPKKGIGPRVFTKGEF